MLALPVLTGTTGSVPLSWDSTSSYLKGLSCSVGTRGGVSLEAARFENTSESQKLVQAVTNDTGAPFLMCFGLKQ